MDWQVISTLVGAVAAPLLLAIGWLAMQWKDSFAKQIESEKAHRETLMKVIPITESVITGMESLERTVLQFLKKES